MDNNINDDQQYLNTITSTTTTTTDTTIVRKKRSTISIPNETIPLPPITTSSIDTTKCSCSTLSFYNTKCSNACSCRKKGNGCSPTCKCKAKCSNGDYNDARFFLVWRNMLLFRLIYRFTKMPKKSLADIELEKRIEKIENCFPSDLIIDQSNQYIVDQFLNGSYSYQKMVNKLRVHLDEKIEKENKERLKLLRMESMKDLPSDLVGLVATNQATLDRYLDGYFSFEHMVNHLQQVQAKNVRRNELVVALAQYKLELRYDSRLCHGYIQGTLQEYWSITSIVQEMCTMKYFFEYCDIKKYLRCYSFDRAKHKCAKEYGIPDVWPWMEEEKKTNQ